MVVEYCIGIIPVLKRFDTGMIKIYFIMETDKDRHKNIVWNRKHNSKRNTRHLYARFFSARHKYQCFTNSENHMPSSEFFRCPSPYRFVFERVVSRNATHKWVDTGRVEETGIVSASMWLETLELSLSREWRSYTSHTFRSAGSATAILLTASPFGCLHHLFQICRIQFTPVTLYMCSPNGFRTPFPAFFPFPLQSLIILSKMPLTISSFRLFEEIVLKRVAQFV